MLSRGRLAVLCALCGAGIAGANEVRVWEGDPAGYQVSLDYRVTITQPGTFKMEALEGGGLGYIRSIAVDFGGADPGDVTVYVVRDPSEVGGSEHEPGATEVWQIDLSGAMTPAYSGTVAELRTTGNYGHTTDGGTLNASAAGDIHIGGDVVMPSTITTAIDIAGATCDHLRALRALRGKSRLRVQGIRTTTKDTKNTKKLAEGVAGSVQLDRVSTHCSSADTPEAVPTAAVQCSRATGAAAVGTLPGRLVACATECVSL
jgi:hypothetical protein